MRPPLVLIAVLTSACASGGAPPPATPPTAVSEPVEPSAIDGGALVARPAPQESEPAPAPPPPEPLKISFPEHGGVEAAIKAVPRGAPRLNMSDDVLQAPLLEMRRYDRCKVPRNTKVNLSVAVYDGAAVGVDVETKPVNAKLNECLDRVVREMSWDKVPSLNQVSVSF